MNSFFSVFSRRSQIDAKLYADGRKLVFHLVFSAGLDLHLRTKMNANSGLSSKVVVFNWLFDHIYFDF